MGITWENPKNLSSYQYICGYCGNNISSEKGWDGRISLPPNNYNVFVYICHVCGKPTFVDHRENQTPGEMFGGDVNYIDNENVEKLYNEARKCTNNKAYTGAILCCRKLLMHIAVSKGAQENLKFIDYVQYLSDNNYIPPDAKDWVDHIREKGNEANHEIIIMEKDDAKDLISFCEMLLKIIYEFPANIRNKTINQNP